MSEPFRIPRARSFCTDAIVRAKHVLRVLDLIADKHLRANSLHACMDWKDTPQGEACWREIHKAIFYGRTFDPGDNLKALVYLRCVASALEDEAKPD